MPSSQEAIPNRGLRSLRYATEWFCAYLLNLLQQKALFVKLTFKIN